MTKIILYVDDAAHACEQIPAITAGAAPGAPHHWVVVACAPRMASRMSKWVSHSARENWRAKWFAKLQAQLLPALRRGGGHVTPVLATGPLTELTAVLKREHAATQVVDARRPRIGTELEPVAPGLQPPRSAGWRTLGGGLGMGTLLVLAHGFFE
ncbi:MAG: hypothetical protein EOP81_05380 [Variovorax sp.]|nr:MAG: hypothetical protein EOP81_05380 [Variovorax sp.]